MKNRYGFTLIELLAVIVVLAIVALITVPQILGFTGSSKKEAAKLSAAHYIEAVENKIITDDYNNIDTPNNIYTVASLDKVNIKGKKPKDGWVEINKKKVVNYALLFDGYIVEYNHGNINIYEGDSIDAPIKYANDVYLLDLSVARLTESGHLDFDTGEKIEHGRRLRTINYEKIIFNNYNVIISTDYILEIFEYDKDYNYLGYVKFNEEGIYEPKENAKYFKIGLRGANGNIEKSLSAGQWVRKFASHSAVAKIYNGDIDSLSKLNKMIYVSSKTNPTSSTIQNELLNDSESILNDTWYALVSNGVYNPSFNENKTTYYVSPDGDDNNSGLLKDYPKKTLDQFSGIDNINILLECGKTYTLSKGFTVGSNVSILSYGEGPRPILSYYRTLNKHFDKVENVDNLYVTDLSDLPDYNGKKDKSDCNFGQLVINGEINWKRVVFGSDSDFSPSMLTNKKVEKSWSIDYKNAKLYIYTISDPNTFDIKYAPGVTALSSKGTSNIVIKGVEITGAGLHAINFTNTKNVTILANSFKYIGGSVLLSAGVRYGNAIQIWDSATNVVVSNNIARWIFDTCYTNQGSSSSMMLDNVKFDKNICIYSQWGLETWGDGGKGFTNIEYSNNLLYHMTDITNPTVKMQVSGSGHLYGELDNDSYISYRNGYTYHQAAPLAFWCASESYMPSIHDNIFWGTNRFLVIGTWYTDTVDIDTLKNNLFYEEYHLSYNTGAALYKFKTTSNKYYTKLSSITSDTTNTESIHKKGSSYDNTSNLARMNDLLNKIITK